MTNHTDAGPEVVYFRDGDLGRIVLSRPKALNALTTSMIRELHRSLDAWERHPGSVLLVESASSKAFCAGGDIRQIRQNTLDDQDDASVEFFTAEYELNARLAELDTPVVALIDGICMGGGLGLSVHGPFRVLTERAVLAMPETAIGFFPDVGGSYFLPRLPGAVGTYLGLTGYRLSASDALYTGLGTHLVDNLDDVRAALKTHPGAVDEALRAHSIRASEPSALAAHRHDIDWTFGATTIADIRHRLQGLDTPWSRQTLAALDAASPQSLEVTLAALAAGRQQNLRQCLALELTLARYVIGTDDFIEGVRAALVDKDRAPLWSDPATNDIDYLTAGLWNRHHLQTTT